MTFLTLHTRAIVMSDECVQRIALLLKKTVAVFKYTSLSGTCSPYYRQKYLVLLLRSLTAKMATNLADFNPDQILVCGVTDCDAAEIFVKAMRHNNVKKLVLHVDKSCRRALADIKYSRDRVELILIL